MKKVNPEILTAFFIKGVYRNTLVKPVSLSFEQILTVKGYRRSYQLFFSNIPGFRSSPLLFRSKFLSNQCKFHVQGNQVWAIWIDFRQATISCSCYKFFVFNSLLTIQQRRQLVFGYYGSRRVLSKGWLCRAHKVFKRDVAKKII